MIYINYSAKTLFYINYNFQITNSMSTIEFKNNFMVYQFYLIHKMSFKYNVL